jgi:hypothetical protein
MAYLFESAGARWSTASTRPYGLNSKPPARRLAGAVCQAEKVRRSKFGIPCAATLSDLKETESDRLTYGRADRMAVDAVGHEVVIGNGKPTVIRPAVMRHFDFDAIKEPAAPIG